MSESYAICVGCYGERYYEQANRMISAFGEISDKPTIFIVTDDANRLKSANFVHTKNIADYDKSYCNYKSDYWNFDFSVRRYSLRFAFEQGFDNTILMDVDVLPNSSNYCHRQIEHCFQDNTISGPVTYNFTEKQNMKHNLGNRLKYYERKFGTNYDKALLNEMPEDCILFFSLNSNTKNKFMETWNECISIKNRDKLPNAPVANIDEICFSAIHCSINLANNSKRSRSLLFPKHDVWYRTKS